MSQIPGDQQFATEPFDVTMCPPLAPLTNDPAVMAHSDQIMQLYNLLNQFIRRTGGTPPKGGGKQPPPPSPPPAKTSGMVLVRVGQLSDNKTTGRYKGEIVATKFNNTLGGALSVLHFVGDSTPCEIWDVQEVSKSCYPTPPKLSVLLEGEYLLGRPIGLKTVGQKKLQVVEVDPTSVASGSINNDATDAVPETILGRNKRFLTEQPYLTSLNYSSETTLLKWVGFKSGSVNYGGGTSMLSGLTRTLMFGTSSDYKSGGGGTLKAGYVSWTLTQSGDVEYVSGHIDNCCVPPCPPEGGSSSTYYYLQCYNGSVTWVAAEECP